MRFPSAYSFVVAGVMATTAIFAYVTVGSISKQPSSARGLRAASSEQGFSSYHPVKRALMKTALSGVKAYNRRRLEQTVVSPTKVGNVGNSIINCFFHEDGSTTVGVACPMNALIENGLYGPEAEITVDFISQQSGETLNPTGGQVTISKETAESIKTDLVNIAGESDGAGARRLTQAAFNDKAKDYLKQRVQYSDVGMPEHEKPGFDFVVEAILVTSNLGD